MKLLREKMKGERSGRNTECEISATSASVDAAESRPFKSGDLHLLGHKHFLTAAHLHLNLLLRGLLLQRYLCRAMFPLRLSSSLFLSCINMSFQAKNDSLSLPWGTEESTTAQRSWSDKINAIEDERLNYGGKREFPECLQAVETAGP